MLLKVVDVPGVKVAGSNIQVSKAKNDSLEVILQLSESSGHIGNEHIDKQLQFSTESFTSPFTSNFLALLAWYFKEYLHTADAQNNDQQISKKLIKFGQYLGDELLGEDHDLLKMLKEIEIHGYENLDVRIESNRPEFFDSLWETLILEESKYVLSAITKSFVRCFTDTEISDEFAELSYDLHVTTPVHDTLMGMLEAPATQENGKSTDAPLRILHIVSRPGNIKHSSNSINLSLKLAELGNAIHHEVVHLSTWDELKSKLSDPQHPVHILHYDGPIEINNNVANIVLADSSGQKNVLAIDQLSQHMVAHKVAALFVEACQYMTEEGDDIRVAQGLALVARMANRSGLGNVVGMSALTDPWTSTDCFLEIYRKIVKGFSLSQAVVEARKSLQASLGNTLFSVDPVAFQAWPLLNQYGGQTVNFFRSPQNVSDTNALHEITQAKLFGFFSEMLPPLLYHVGDGEALFIIDKINSSPKGCAFSIHAEAGEGKTQVAHLVNLYLAKNESIDFGFYFDFTEEIYSSNDMLKMIAPVLGLSADDGDNKAELGKRRCSFVLDNFSSNISDETKQGLQNFLQQLVAQGHYIIFLISEDNLSIGWAKIQPLVQAHLKISSLPLLAQKILASDILRKEKLTSKINISEAHTNVAALDALLKSLNGNPWLIKKTLPLLVNFSPEQLQPQVETHILNRADVVQQFYAWQWSLMPVPYQKLMVLCSQDRGLLLEMLVTAAEQKETFAPAKDLFDALGDPQASFSKAIDIWEQSGFVGRFPHGRIIDSCCLDFIESKNEQIMDKVLSEKIQLLYSQVLSEGVRILALHLIKQPNPHIMNNLLFNRRKWVQHLERLWFNKDYAGFIRTKAAFDQLLQQAKLVNESSAWSLDLVSRTPVIGYSDEVGTEAKLSWLNLAMHALNQQEAISQENILRCIEYWKLWCEQLSEFSTQEQFFVFQQAASFLEKYFQIKTEWDACISLCEKSYVIYRKYAAWHKVVETLKNLSNYHVARGELAIATEYETKIMTEIPYEEAPSGYKAQQMTEILFMRLKRTSADDAQKVLNKLRELKEASNMVELLDGAQCDIYYQQKNYLAALPYYCRFWVRANQQRNTTQATQIKQRLCEIEELVGTDAFNECYDNEVSDDIEKPNAMMVH